MEDLKLCSFCGFRKPLGEFNHKKKTKFLSTSYCKSCKSSYNKQNYQKNKQRILARVLAYDRKNREEKRLDLAAKQKLEAEVAELKRLTKPGRRNSLKEYKKMMKNSVITVSDLVD